MAAFNTSLPLNQQNFVIPNTGGATIALNNVGTAGAQVIGPDQSRKSISFGNPNASVTLYVYQTVDINGNALNPSVGSPGGAWPIFAGAILTWTGDIQGAWGAFAASGSTNGLSVLSSRS